MALANNVQLEYFNEPKREPARPASDMRRTQGNVEGRRGRRTGPVTPTDANPFYETQDEAFSRQYDATQRYTNPKNNQINRVERTYAPENDNQPLYQPSSVPQVRKQVNHKNKASDAELLTARLKLTAINGWVGGWAMFWYLSFQLPFALISVVGLGMAAAVYSYINNNIVEPVEGVTGIDLNGFFIDITSGMNNVLSRVTDSFFNIPFDPLTLFIVPFSLIFLLTLFQLILTWSIYSLAGIKSLSGQRGGLKHTMFLLAGVGAVIPILNLFPLIFLWMVVVWKWPK